MKTIAKPIQMISWTEEDGSIHPLRFKVQEQEGTLGVYKILKMYTCSLDTIAGDKVIIFTCEINMHEFSKICELRYYVDACQWNLFKL